jgi:hypothetical protein
MLQSLDGLFRLYNTSSMTLSRIQQLESLGFEWDSRGAAWEDRLIELAAYREIHGHCNVPRNSENSKLGKWVGNQNRRYYNLYRDGKISPITSLRIQQLESMGFDWGVCATPWEDRLSELDEYRKIQGHCNVPKNYSDNTKLAYWVGRQRQSYNLHLQEKRSSMTLPCIHVLDSIGFEWGTARKDRLSELAAYRKIHGHCNVPYNCRENTKLASWVSEQRIQYKMHREGKKSQMTLSRIQGLESLGSERKKVTPKKPSLDNDVTSVRERAPRLHPRSKPNLYSNSRKEALQVKLPWLEH